MIRNSSSGASVDVAVAAEPVAFVGFAICPLCHTADAVVTRQAVSEGAEWRCSRCSHPWDRMRLATADAYSLYLASTNGLASRHTKRPVMTSESTAANRRRTQIVSELHELIAALDRRVPHVERVGEIADCTRGRGPQRRGIETDCHARA